MPNKYGYYDINWSGELNGQNILNSFFKFLDMNII